MKANPKISNDLDDPVLTEVRAAKLKLSSEYGFDLRRIGAAARMRQKSSGRNVVSKSAKKILA